MSSKEALVVVVTGASRGLGRGVARAFGSKRAMVYVTGRSTDGSLEAAAGEISAAGGYGVAVRCDHGQDDQVEAFFARVKDEAGRLDILVNNAAAMYPEALMAPGGFWEKPLRNADMLDVGLRSNFVAAYFAAPIMVAAKRGLIANVSSYGAVSHFFDPTYGAAKSGTDKMSQDMAVDLKPHNVAVVSIWPGYVLTDTVKAMAPELMPEEYRKVLPDFETPEFTGLVLDALYRDPALLEVSGRGLIAAELGVKFGVKDLDGKQPKSYRALKGGPAEPFVPSA